MNAALNAALQVLNNRLEKVRASISEEYETIEDSQTKLHESRLRLVALEDTKNELQEAILNIAKAEAKPNG